MNYKLNSAFISIPWLRAAVYNRGSKTPSEGGGRLAGSAAGTEAQGGTTRA